MTVNAPHASAGPATMSGKPSGFRSLVGYHTVKWERDFGEIALRLTPHHGNSIGITHGGVYMTLMDAAMGHAATWCAVPGNLRICVTVSMTTSFVQPARGTVIRAIGRLVGIHDRIATVWAEVLDEDGTLLASGQGSFRYSPGSEAYDGVPKSTTRR